MRIITGFDAGWGHYFWPDNASWLIGSKSQKESLLLLALQTCAMRSGLSIWVLAADGRRLETIVADHNSLQKHFWQAWIVLLTQDGLGTAATIRGACVSKTLVWLSQEQFIAEGAHGLLRDRTLPASIPPTPPETVDEINRLAWEPRPHQDTQWTFRATAARASRPPPCSQSGRCLG